jgi:predicted RNase H-like nuclease
LKKQPQTKIIGIDCATQPKKVGLALCRWTENRLMVDTLRTGADSRPLHQVISDWIPDEGALLAMDAPLGWPQGLAPALVQHRAGQALATTPEKMFRRTTDDFVWEMTGKKPMEVGAERIARTAHAALRLLNEISILRGTTIPLCWTADTLSRGQVAAIEVYPAGLMAALGVKRPSREDKISALERLTDLGAMSIDESVTADMVDAVLCAVAGADFLQGKCYAPSPKQLPVAKKEGWIWVRR